MDKENLKQLKARRETVKMSLRTLRSDLQNPARLEQENEKDLAEVAMIQKRVAARNRRLESLQDVYETTKLELSKLNKALKIEENSVKIRTLNKIASSISNLEGSLTIEQIEAALIERKENMCGENNTNNEAEEVTLDEVSRSS